MATTLRRQNSTPRLRPVRPKSARPNIITLSDLTRIQQEINPVSEEEQNRKHHEEKLKKLSRGHILNFEGTGMCIAKEEIR